ncbi:Ras-related GTP-binding protein Rab3 [Operophtera brumata]|uniref:Ras-related GTP-binding protein Rab3 n=1 Tax=Operophtera brumata TaxID=104452 RepID=A0A0L7LGH7_OPEBR|nr:Ras-related GTP-binding protein Rab3 [Operophtera brumata]
MHCSKTFALDLETASRALSVYVALAWDIRRSTSAQSITVSPSPQLFQRRDYAAQRRCKQQAYSKNIATLVEQHLLYALTNVAQMNVLPHLLLRRIAPTYDTYESYRLLFASEDRSFHLQKVWNVIQERFLVERKPDLFLRSLTGCAELRAHPATILNFHPISISKGEGRSQDMAGEQKWQKDSGDQNFDYMFKLLIIGNSSVGKTR